MISPYEVKVEGKQYVFDTALGLTNEVRFTLFAIIDEFFHENEDVLLYMYAIPATTARQPATVSSYAGSSSLPGPTASPFRSAATTIEGQGFYAAIIVENRNPLLTDITADFDKTAITLTNKPSE